MEKSTGTTTSQSVAQDMEQRHVSAPGRIKHAVWHCINVLAMCRYLVSLAPALLFPSDASSSPLTSHGPYSTALHTAAMLVPLVIAAVCSRLIWMGWRRKLTRMQQADWTLVMLAVLVTVGNLVLRRSQLELQDTAGGAGGAPGEAAAAAHWPSHFAFCMVLGVLMDLPVQHSLVQGILTVPFLLALDYQELCWANSPSALPLASPMCGSGSADAGSCIAAAAAAAAAAGLNGRACPPLLRYLLIRGPLGVLTCLAAGITPIIIFMKARSATVDQGIPEPGEEQQQGSRERQAQGSSAGARADGQQQQQQQQAESEFPFDSFGPWGRAVGQLFHPLLVDLEAKVERWVQSINGPLVVRLLCLPIAVYYLSRTLVSRFMPQSQAVQEVSADEWLLVMAVFFLLGRDSSTLDMVPLLHQIQERLRAALKTASMTQRSPSPTELMDSMRLHVMGSATSGVLGTLAGEQLKLVELLGEGSFGKVYKALWQGTTVAVKCMLLPSGVPDVSRKERLAIMEAAISSSLSHPNVIQTYAYSVDQVQQQVQQQGSVAAAWHETQSRFQEAAPAPATSQPQQQGAGAGGTEAGDKELGAQQQQQQQQQEGGQCAAGRDPAGGASGGAEVEGANRNSRSTSSAGVTSLEVRIVLEFADCGTLRQQLDKHLFFNAGTQELNYKAVLETAADIAKGMLHLHSLNILHSDLKALNVLLVRSASEPKGITAKVADFGMSLKMDTAQTHISNAFFGTMTHSAPEVILEGHQTKASDVYSFGIILYELYTSGRPYKGISPALLAYQVSQQQLRPSFPSNAPPGYIKLAERCWDPQPHNRPTFGEALEVLRDLRDLEPGDTEELRVEGGRAPRFSAADSVTPSGPDQPQRRSSSTPAAPEDRPRPRPSCAAAAGAAAAPSAAHAQRHAQARHPAPPIHWCRDQEALTSHSTLELEAALAAAVTAGAGMCAGAAAADEAASPQPQSPSAAAALGGLFLTDLSESYF